VAALKQNGRDAKLHGAVDLLHDLVDRQCVGILVLGPAEKS
jgi:hypothetical protein